MTGQSTFTQEIADIICERIAEGESLRKICLDDGLPTKTTVMRWLADESNATFRDQYARARDAQADYYAERTITESESALGLDGPGVGAKRLLVDTLKWHASKLAPKKYGDRLDVGNAEDKPFKVDDSQASVRLAAILAAAQDRKNQAAGE